jgi:hypothetical protein
MNQVRTRLRIVGALAIATALVWGSGMLASALPQSERVHAAVHSVGVVDYATDVVAPGSRFSNSRPTYDQ